MVVRLFIPPCEGQYHIVPKRPEPVGANATIYVIVAATVVAAGHASIAAKFARRTIPHAHISRTALFVTSSARLGTYAIAAGAAVNTYYHKSFTSVMVKEFEEWTREPIPAKLWERTEKYTAEDGCLVGAAVGAAAFLPTLFMRRPSVPWWTRLVGMATIGASAGLVASQAYFQYNGERAKALEELDWQRRRRALEFHHIFWNKVLMARFDPLIQQYVRHNGVFHAYHIPAQVYENPEKYGILSKAPAEKNTTTQNSSTPAVAEDGFYQPAQDHAHILRNLNVKVVRGDIERGIQERCALLKEAEYVYYQMTERQHQLCTTTWSNEEDRQDFLREIQLMSIVYNRLRSKAEDIDRGNHYGRVWLQQKAALDANQPRMAWLSSLTTAEPDSHDPDIFIIEAKRLQEQYAQDIKTWDSLCNSQASEHVAKREKYKRDLDDARSMLRAADQVVFELEKRATDLAKRKVGAAKRREKLESSKSSEPGEPENS